MGRSPASSLFLSLSLLASLSGCDDSPITVEECQSRGGEPIPDPGDGSRHAEGCPDGRTELGTIDPIGFGPEGGICCERTD